MIQISSRRAKMAMRFIVVGFDALRPELATPENAPNLAAWMAGGARFMILVLEYEPRTRVLEWADTVVSAHPDHNVILLTHSYLDHRGERRVEEPDRVRGVLVSAHAERARPFDLEQLPRALQQVGPGDGHLNLLVYGPHYFPRLTKEVCRPPSN